MHEVKYEMSLKSVLYTLAQSTELLNLLSLLESLYCREKQLIKYVFRSYTIGGFVKEQSPAVTILIMYFSHPLFSSSIHFSGFILGHIWARAFDE